MSDTDLAARLDAVERAITDDGTDLTDARDDADLAAAVEDLEARVADLEATVEELDAGLQAVRGYAGNLRAVNRDVERRASAALAKAETLESSVERGASDPASSERHHGGPLTVEGTDRDRHRDGTERDHHDGNDRDHHHDGTKRDHHRRAKRDTGTRAVTPASGDHDTQTSRFEAERTDGRSPVETGHPRTGGTAARSSEPGSNESDGDRSGADSQTEQFIERVRDAL